MDVVGQLQVPDALFRPAIKNKRLSGPQRGLAALEGQFLAPCLEFSVLRPVAYDVYLGDPSGSLHNGDYCFPV